MATISTLKAGGTTGTAAGTPYTGVLTHEITVADAVTAGLVTTDKVTIFSVPADTTVIIRQIEIVDAAVSLGAGARVDVGDSSSDTTYVSNASTLTEGTSLTLAATTKTYTAADSVFIKITGGTIASQGTFRIVYHLINTGRNAIATERDYPN